MHQIFVCRGTATVAIPNSRQARRMRRAISPRLAIKIFLKMRHGLIPENDERLAKFNRLPHRRIKFLLPHQHAVQALGSPSFMASTISRVCPSFTLSPTATRQACQALVRHKASRPFGIQPQSHQLRAQRQYLRGICGGICGLKGAGAAAGAIGAAGAGATAAWITCGGSLVKRRRCSPLQIQFQ